MTPDQLKYVTSNSITTFGPANIIARNQWDIFAANIVLNRVSAINGYPLLDLAALVAQICLWVYQVKFGRLHAWNRNRWTSFDTFEESERKWYPWAIAGIVFLAIDIVYEISRAA